MQNFLIDYSIVFPAIFFKAAETHSASFEADVLLTLPVVLVEGFQIATKPSILSLNNL
jgi:hypothetical protein